MGRLEPRNNTPQGTHIPTEWNVGSFDRDGKWIKDDATNVKWVAQLGSQSYGNPVVANGQVYVGTNNGAGNLKRYPATVDLGVLVCFNERDGTFLWQHSNEKLPTGRVHDWPLQGVCAAPLVEGERLWYVTNRGEVVCLDTKGFYDNKDNGPVVNEPGRLFDLMKGDDPAQDQVARHRGRTQRGQDHRGPLRRALRGRARRARRRQSRGCPTGFKLSFCRRAACRAK